MASIYLVQLIPLQPLLRNTFNCFSSNIILYPSLFFWGLFVFSNLYHTIRYELSLYFLKLIFRCANDNHDIIKASKIFNQVKLAHPVFSYFEQIFVDTFLPFSQIGN